jgi:hypothetical protein
MKPEETLDPDKLPDELRLLAQRHKLQLTDPVFALIAWHWHNVQQAENKLSAIALEIQARTKVMIQSADSVTGLGGQLAEVKEALAARPLAIAQKLERDLVQPVAAVVATFAAAEQALRNARTVVEQARRREALAAFVLGMAFGASLLAWVAA